MPTEPTQPPDRTPSRPRSILSTLVVLGAFVLLVGIGWTMTNMQVQLVTVRDEQARLHELAGRIRYYDELLTMSAAMAAATGERQWQSRYEFHAPLLDSAIEELRTLSPAVFAASGGADLSDSNARLVEIERRALTAARAGNRAASRVELASTEYGALKLRYSGAVDRIVFAMRAEINRTATALMQSFWTLVGISVTAVVAGGGLCVVLGSRTHRRARELAEAMTATLRRSEGELRKLALVASRTDNAVLITDAAGRIDWVNDGFARLTGFQGGEVAGSCPASLFRCPGADAGAIARLERCFADGVRFAEEVVGWSRSGRKYWVSLDLEPIRSADGRLTQFFAIMRDVTDRKEAAERLQRSNDEILEANRKLGEQARELQVRAVELERATRAAEDASRAKTEFLANMSHEIRTPLNGVVGALELMARTELDERQARFCRMASVSGEALLSLINDILDYSKLDAGAVELETIDVDLRALCAELGDVFARRVEDKGVTLSCEVSPRLPPVVRGDPTRLRQVLLNLISNAVKFTSRGGVVVRATPEREEAGSVHVRFTVTDSGIGIPPDRMDRLFRSFSQVDASTTRRYGGTGLGLAICKDVVELMGGQIGVSSEPGLGSTFWFVVPLGVADDAPGRPAAAPGDRRLQDAAALALSDDGEVRGQLAALLADWRFRHAAAAADDAGLARALAGPAPGSAYDVVLLHAPTPGAALPLLRRLAPDPARARFGVVLIVDDDADAAPDVRRLRAAGVTAWLRRPIDAGDLLDAIIGTLAACRRAEPPASAPARAGLRADLPAGLRVLVAEDNEINQAIATELLAEAGVETGVAPNGARAVVEAMTGGYDLILMDCQMPEFDGFEAATRLRAVEATGRTLARAGGRLPIIALTANAMPDDRERCLRAGMDDYLTKPLDPELLMAAIRRYAPGMTPPAAPGAPAAADGGVAASPPGSQPPSQPDPQPDPQHGPQPGPLPGPEPEPGPRAAAGPAESAGVAPGAEAAGEPAPGEWPTADAEGSGLATLDLEGLRSRCRGKAALMASVLDKFASLLPGQVAECRAAGMGGDLALAARAAHGVKGAAANVGALAVADAAGRLEAAARAGDREGVSLAQAALERRCVPLAGGLARACDALRAAGASTDRPTGPTATNAERRA